MDHSTAIGLAVPWLLLWTLLIGAEPGISCQSGSLVADWEVSGASSQTDVYGGVYVGRSMTLVGQTLKLTHSPTLKISTSCQTQSLSSPRSSCRRHRQRSRRCVRLFLSLMPRLQRVYVSLQGLRRALNVALSFRVRMAQNWLGQSCPRHFLVRASAAERRERSPRVYRQVRPFVHPFFGFLQSLSQDELDIISCDVAAGVGRSGGPARS